MSGLAYDNFVDAIARMRAIAVRSLQEMLESNLEVLQTFLSGECVGSKGETKLGGMWLKWVRDGLNAELATSKFLEERLTREWSNDVQMLDGVLGAQRNRK